MKLILILLASLFINIYIPSIYMPTLFLGVLIIYILSRKYVLFLISLLGIIFVLQSFSLTRWWEIALYYCFWSLGIYMFSIFLDKSWIVQSIIATVWLFLCKFIVSGFNLDYLSLTIYTLVNFIGIIIFLYLAEKLKLYEQLA